MTFRQLSRITIGIAGVVLAMLAVSVNVGFQELDNLDPDAALRVMPWNASANALAAENALMAQQYAKAGQLADRSLDRSLLNVRALRTLALSRQARNPNDGSVLPGMLLAGQLGWRDTATQYWLMIAAFQAGNYQVALQRANALLRRDQNTDDVLALLRAAGTVPEARRAVVETLETRPGWRLALFQTGALPDQQARGMEAIAAALQHSAAPPSRTELWSYLDGLMRARDYDRAYRVWKTGTGNNETGWPHDPRFTAAAARAAASEKDQFPFEWNFRAGPSTTLRFGPPTQGGIVLDGITDRIPDFLSQVMHVPPGTHRLDIRLSGAGRDALNALQWNLLCATSRKQILGQPTISAAAGTTLISYSFTTTGQDCGYQRLGLTLRPPMDSRGLSMTIQSVSVTG